jgi:hypothetical protein
MKIKLRERKLVIASILILALAVVCYFAYLSFGKNGGNKNVAKQQDALAVESGNTNGIAENSLGNQNIAQGDLQGQSGQNEPVATDQQAGGKFSGGIVAQNKDYGFQLTFPKEGPMKNRKEIVSKISDSTCKDCALVTYALQTEDKNWRGIEGEDGKVMNGYAAVFGILVVDLADAGNSIGADVCMKEFGAPCPESAMTITQNEKYSYRAVVPVAFPDDLKNLYDP